MTTITISVAGTDVWMRSAAESEWTLVGPDTPWNARLWRDTQVLTAPLENGHTHPLQSMLRFGNQRDPCEFEEWLARHILPFQARATPEIFYEATHRCLAENLLCGGLVVHLHCKGIQTWADLDAIGSACADSVVRATVYVGVYGEDVLTDRAASLMATAADAIDGRAEIGIGPVNLADFDSHGVAKLIAIAEEFQARIHTHASETSQTRGSIAKLLGYTSDLRRWDLVHCIYDEAETLRAAVAAGATLVTCPLSNAFLNLRQWDSSLLAQAHAVRIGSDGNASSGSQSVLRSAFAGWLLWGGHAGPGRRPSIGTLFQTCVAASRSRALPCPEAGDCLVWRPRIELGHPNSVLLELLSSPDGFDLVDAIVGGESQRLALAAARRTVQHN